MKIVVLFQIFEAKNLKWRDTFLDSHVSFDNIKRLHVDALSSLSSSKEERFINNLIRYKVKSPALS